MIGSSAVMSARPEKRQGGRGPGPWVPMRLVAQRGGYMNGRFFTLNYMRIFFKNSSAKKWGGSGGSRPPSEKTSHDLSLGFTCFLETTIFSLGFIKLFFLLKKRIAFPQFFFLEKHYFP